MAEKYTIELEVDSKNSKQSVDTLAKAIDELSKSVDKFGDESKENIGGVTKESKEAKKGILNLSTGFKGLGVAMKAAGIGLIVSAFVFLKEAVQSNQQVMDAINVVFGTFKVIATEVTKVLVGVYNSVSQSTDNFDALGKVMSSILTLVITPFKLGFQAIKSAIILTQIAWEKSFFGSGDTTKIDELNASLNETSEEFRKTIDGAVDAGKSIVNNFGEAVTEVGAIGTEVIDGLKTVSISAAIETSKTLKDLKKSADIAIESNRGLIEEYDRQAEQQRQIRDNDLISIEQRIVANDKLKETLEEQERLMLQNARAVQAQAQAQFDLTGRDEDRIRLLQTKNEVKAVEAQIEGFMSEQEANRVALLKEKIELEQFSDEATAIRQNEQRLFNAEMIQNDVQRLQIFLDNLEIEKEAEEKRLQEKRNAFQQGTQAYIDANNELLDYQQANANQQEKIEQELGDAKSEQIKKTLGDIATIVGQNSKFGKAVAIAQALQDTYAGANKALAQGGIYGFIGAAAVIATGVRNVKQIASTKPPKPPAGLRGGGASTSVQTPSISTPTAPQTPSFDILGTSGVNQIASALGQQAPVQAFVVSQDVTTAQSLQNNIVQGASLG